MGACVDLEKIESRKAGVGKGLRLAVIDDSQMQLKFFDKVFKKAFQRTGDTVDCFLYPHQEQELLDKANNYDVIVIDYMLGGVNGANFGRNLFKRNCPAKIVVFSASEKTDLTKLSFYFEKGDLAKNPKKLLCLPDSEVGQAVEMAYLAGRNIVPR